MTTMYCLRHDSWEQVTHGKHLDFLPAFDGYAPEVEVCEGPFTYSEPPDVLTERDWQDVFEQEPDPFEMAQINDESSQFFADAE